MAVNGETARINMAPLGESLREAKRQTRSLAMPKFTVRSADRRGGQAGPRLGVQHKTRLVGKRELQPYAPHGMETTKC